MVSKYYLVLSEKPSAARRFADYSLTELQVINQVTAALNTNNRGTMLTLANQLDAYNNLG